MHTHQHINNEKLQALTKPLSLYRYAVLLYRLVHSGSIGKGHQACVSSLTLTVYSWQGLRWRTHALCHGHWTHTEARSPG